MSERERGEGSIQDRLFVETSGVMSCLDESDHLLYERIPPERVERMSAEVGEVRNLVEQVPIHRQPTEIALDETTNIDEALLDPVELFTRSMGNFSLLFNPESMVGQRLREEPYMRRFRILFPGFDSALIAQNNAYHRRILAERFFPVREEVHARGLMVAYAALSQLVDADDECLLGGRIRDLEHPEWVVRGGR